MRTSRHLSTTGSPSGVARPSLQGHVEIARVDHWFKNVYKKDVIGKPEFVKVAPPSISMELKKRWSDFVKKVYETAPPSLRAAAHVGPPFFLLTARRTQFNSSLIAF